MSVTVLFDDVSENRVRIREGFGKSQSTTLVDFDASRELPPKSTYERHIEAQLSDVDRNTPINLIACDKELGLYENYRGLSAITVSAVARNLGIPFCQYSRNFRTNLEFERFEELRRWNSDEITLVGQEPRDWGRQIRGFLEGFEFVRRAYSDPALHKLKPASALARIMGRPNSASKLRLYGEGDQSVMTEIFALLSTDPDATKLAHRMPRILGTWLWLSILRFPGLLVDKVAAASFLNVSENDFERGDIRSKFSSAVYSGPFSSLGEWWWREDLETIVLDSGASDGHEYLRSLDIEVARCLDEQTGEVAGYFCMISGRPISLTNSVGDIGWFPPGADLSRIRNDNYEEITSLISI